MPIPEKGRGVLYHRYGIVTYTMDGLLHNIGQAAVEYPNGKREYWQHGRLHRKEGPAITYRDGSENQYYLNGVQVTKEEHALQVGMQSERA